METVTTRKDVDFMRRPVTETMANNQDRWTTLFSYFPWIKETMAFLHVGEEREQCFFNRQFVSLKYKLVKRSIQGYTRALPN